jgi:Kef-type K+ transport system membrane component KefB
MGIINKAWKRVAWSLIVGGITAELVDINTGKGAGSNEYNNIVLAVVFIVVMSTTSAFVFFNTRKKARKESRNEELLDC